MHKFNINIKFIFLAIISFAFSYFQGENLFYYISYIFIITFILGFIYVNIQIKDVDVDIQLEKEAYFVGESDKIAIDIYNKSFLPCISLLLKNDGLTCLNENFKGSLVYLLGQKVVTVKSNIKFKTRGSYELGTNDIKINDLFYIFNVKKEIRNQKKIKVYPKIFDVNKKLIENRNIFLCAKKSNRYGEDLYNVSDIRKYMVGDNFKRINWKISAHHGELFVKNYDFNSGKENIVFLNMNKENYFEDMEGIQEELLIDSCASIVNCALVKSIKSRVFINYENSEKFYIANQKGFNDLMEFFVANKSKGDKDFMNFINYNIESVNKVNRIVIICMKVNDIYLKNILNLRNKGYNITLFYANKSDDNSHTADLLKGAAVECINLKRFLQ